MLFGGDRALMADNFSASDGRLPVGAGPVASRNLGTMGCIFGNVEGKGGAAAGPGFVPNRAAMMFDDGFGNAQPQSRTALGAGVGGIRLAEFLENPVFKFRGYSGSTVGDRYTQIAIQFLARDIDCAARWRELGGVGKEVAHNLDQAVLVSHDHAGMSILGNFEAYIIGLFKTASDLQDV